MLKIGLTGAIGSGKTTCCKVFSLLGVPIFYADMEAKKLLSREDIIGELSGLFSKEILWQSQIDKKKLAKIVFQDTKALALLNKTIHPRLFKYFEEWAEQQEGAYVIAEAAILFESGMDKIMNFVIDVESNLSLQIERVCLRDKTEESQVRQRLQNQLSSDERIKGADWIIHNQEEHLIIPQVLSIHSDILKKCPKSI